MSHSKRSKRQLTQSTAARRLSDLYCLWRLCGTQACRRSRECKGDARSCFLALPLVPKDALAFLQAFDEGQADSLSFDEMMALNADEWDAVNAWRERVASTLPNAEA